MGFLPIGTIGLGILEETSRMRVPRPPHKITVFIGWVLFIINQFRCKLDDRIRFSSCVRSLICGMEFGKAERFLCSQRPIKGIRWSLAAFQSAVVSPTKTRSCDRSPY